MKVQRAHRDCSTAHCSHSDTVNAMCWSKQLSNCGSHGRYTYSVTHVQLHPTPCEFVIFPVCNHNFITTKISSNTND
jgi:hypothetical protein